MALADQRAKDHPEDAVPIYQREIESTLQHGGNDSYAAAVKLLKKVQQLMLRTNHDFASYLESVRCHQSTALYLSMSAA
jgi:uncharacterized Zn finger protein